MRELEFLIFFFCFCFFGVLKFFTVYLKRRYRKNLKRGKPRAVEELRLSGSQSLVSVITGMAQP